MKLVLMEKDLWGFVEGSETRPSDTAEDSIRRKFKSRSDKAYSLIALSVETSLQIHIVATTDPKEAWEILKDHFSFVSITQIVRLNRKFYAASMRESDDMKEHITLMTSLAQQLRELGEVIDSQKFATVFMGSLPPSYDTYITSLNARKAADLDWETIRGSLQEEYMKRKEKNANTNLNNEALFMGGGPGTRNNRQHNHQHYHQQRNNNNNRYDNFSGNSSRNNNNNGHGRSGNQQVFERQNTGNNSKNCFRCGGLGHISRNCGTMPSNQIRGANNRGHQPINPEQGNLMDSFRNFSIHDDVALIASNVATIHGDWFIDSGATSHMTYERDAFIDYEPYDEPRGVAMGDNVMIFAEGNGTVNLQIHKDESDEIININ